MARKKKKAAPKKKRAPKKGRAQSRVDGGPEAEALAITEAPVIPEPTEDAESDPPVEDLDVDLDLDANVPGDIEGLVAEVARLDEVDAVAAKDVDVVVVDDPEEVAEPLEDVDAVLDDELEKSGELEELIALTAGVADRDDPVAEPQMEAPDDDLPIEVLDDGLAEEERDPLTTPAFAPTAAPTGETSVPTAAELAAAVTSETDTTTEQDLEGAIDLGPGSTPEVRDRLLAQALAHSELQDARYRVPLADNRARRWKGTVASVLLLTAAVLTVAPPGWVRPAPPAQLNASERSSSIRTALLLQAQQVDAYRVRFQRLPDSLDELASRLPGVRFVKSGNRAYQLIGYAPGGNLIIYDSSNPDPEFDRLTASWSPGAAP